MKDLADHKRRYDEAYNLLFPKSRSWRLRFFHWLTQGQITIKEEKQMSSNVYQSAYGQLQTVQLAGSNSMNLPGITFKITSANGGTIISVNESPSQYTLGTNDSSEQLYIIPDGVEDFDRELGKIITMYRIKQK
jgi:hypothetical protein